MSDFDQLEDWAQKCRLRLRQEIYAIEREGLRLVRSAEGEPFGAETIDFLDRAKFLLRSLNKIRPDAKLDQ